MRPIFHAIIDRGARSSECVYVGDPERGSVHTQERHSEAQRCVIESVHMQERHSEAQRYMTAIHGSSFLFHDTIYYKLGLEIN